MLQGKVPRALISFQSLSLIKLTHTAAHLVCFPSTINELSHRYGIIAPHTSSCHNRP